MYVFNNFQVENLCITHLLTHNSCHLVYVYTLIHSFSNDKTRINIIKQAQLQHQIGRTIVFKGALCSFWSNLI